MQKTGEPRPESPGQATQETQEARPESLTRLIVRYAETDRMGVVHHSHYPVYFEAGRTDFFCQHALPYHEMEQQGLFAPVLELSMELQGRASYGDVLLLVTRPLWLRGVRLAMGYQVTRESDGGAVASGQTVHALVGADLRPVHPRRFQALYDGLRTLFPA